MQCALNVDPCFWLGKREVQLHPGSLPLAAISKVLCLKYPQSSIV